jgi:putative spermidine/putrescine transport system ATP-binding protein
MPEIALHAISKRFGRVKAVDELTLTLGDGEFFVLLGPTGAGKTTTLRLIAGLEVPDAGRIGIGGEDATGWSVAQRDVALVFQYYSLYPRYTVRQNLAFPLRSDVHHFAPEEIERRVSRAAKMLRIEHLLERKTDRLSGGEMQRVSIGRAIVRDPTVFLMDEPLSNLDAKLRLEMRAEIRRIHNELGATTIYVTHDQDEALSLADRIVVLRDGVIRQVGTPKELYEAPSYLDVADFMGFRNKLQGTVVANENSRVILDVEGARISGVARESLSVGSSAYAAIRPDDLVVGEPGQNAISVIIDSIEYRGREFVGLAHSAGGLDFVFRSHRPFEPGATIHLTADDERVLVFAEPIQGRN